MQAYSKLRIYTPGANLSLERKCRCVSLSVGFMALRKLLTLELRLSGEAHKTLYEILNRHRLA